MKNKEKYIVGRFCGLTGVKDDVVIYSDENVYFNTSDEAIATLENNGKITYCPGDEGMITAWVRDDGKFGCMLEQYFVKKSDLVFDDLHGLKAQIDLLLPKTSIQ